MHIEVITPEGTAYEGEAESVTIPTRDGEITVLKGHVPLISIIAPGMMIVRSGKEEHAFAVARGVIEVEKQSVRILSDIADRVESLEEEAVIEAAKARAEKIVADKRTDSEGFADATAILDRELARLASVRRRRPGRRISS